MSLRTHLDALLEWLLPPCLRLVTKDCVQPVALQDINLVVSLTRLLQALIVPYLQPPSPPPIRLGVPPQPPPVVDMAAKAIGVECLFLFALVWSVGSTVDGAGREVFSSHMRNFLSGDYGAYSSHVTSNACPLKRPLPAKGSVYDWMYDTASDSWKGEQSCCRSWSHAQPPAVVKADTESVEHVPGCALTTLLACCALRRLDGHQQVPIHLPGR